MGWTYFVLFSAIILQTFTQGNESTSYVSLICGKDDSTEWDCSMDVKYSKMDKISCNVQVENNDANRLALKNEPTITATLSEPIQDGVLIMYDPDVPGSPNHDHGFAHWVTLVSTDVNGVIQVKKDKEFLEYYPPTPPAGSGPHRYQFFLFRSDKKELKGVNSRGINLCSVITENGLGSPMASFEYMFENKN